VSAKKRHLVFSKILSLFCSKFFFFHYLISILFLQMLNRIKLQQLAQRPRQEQQLLHRDPQQLHGEQQKVHKGHQHLHGKEQQQE